MSKVALVTGGSGALGQAIVRRLGADGLRVAFSWRRNQAAAEALARETGTLPLQAELTDPAAVEGLVDRLAKELGEVEILINNAGQTQVLPFAMIEAEDWDEVIAANLKSMFLVTHAVVRGMIARKAGVIINIGSLAGHRMLEVPVHYATAKAGVTGFTLALARELARYKIRVNEVVPGLLTDGVGKMVPEKELAEYVSYCTAGRAGEPEEVAELVAFVASERARYINAQSLHINGGI